MMKARFPMVLITTCFVFIQVFLVQAQAACSLQFSSPSDSATVTASAMTVYGQGGADAQHGDSGTVTATLNGTVFLTIQVLSLRRQIF